MEMSRLTRDGTAKPVSRDQILRHSPQRSCRWTGEPTPTPLRVAPASTPLAGDILKSRREMRSRLAVAASPDNKEPMEFLKNFLSFGRRVPKPLVVEVAVIGAGVAGLVCARILTRGGFMVKLLEASDGVFIEAYPEPKRQLNYKKLRLQRFNPGAVVRSDSGFHCVSDPIRKPEALLDSLAAPVGTLADKIRVGLHRLAIIFSKDEDIFNAAEKNTHDFLAQDLELSDSMISKFFAPFYQGIFLSPLKEQSSRMFEFVFKMFAVGAAALPEGGMGQVPEQIASDLPKDCLLLKTEVTSVTTINKDGEENEDKSLTGCEDEIDGCPRVRLKLTDGSEILAYAAVIATEAPAAVGLLGDGVLEGGARPSRGRSSTCLYFAIDGPAPIDGPILLLNGEGTDPRRPVNNVVFLEQTAPSYAPEGKSLASVTVVGDPKCSDRELEMRVRDHLAEWFAPGQGGTGAEGGPVGTVPTRQTDVAKWRHLRTYRVPYAQPAQTPPVEEGGFYARKAELGDGIFVCGDHRATPTLDGAMRSGVLAAEAVVRSIILENRPPVMQGRPYKKD